MKKSNLLFIIIGLLSFCGCDDFLNEEPDDRAKVESPSDIKELLVNAYPRAAYLVICEMMSDNVADRGFSNNCATEITDDEMYRWKDGTDSDADSPFAVWTGWYEGIAAANYALRVIDSKPDQENYKAMRGEALLCRALGHFLSVNLWAEHYDPATASVALGIPYVTEPETVAVKEYKRNTMEEVYNMIEADLRRGLALIDDKSYTMPKFHFTKRAAHAFAARFYTYKGTDWDKVIYHSLQAVPESFATEMRDYSALADMTVMEYMKEYTNPALANILLAVCMETYWNDLYQTCPPKNSRYVLSPAMAYSLFQPNSSNNLQRGLWVYRKEGTGTSVSSMVKFYAYFKTISETSNWGNTYLNLPMFTVEDVALNRAEAYTMQGDTTRALQTINQFLSMRTVDYNPAKHSLNMKKIITFFQEPSWDDQRPEPHYKAELDADKNKLYLMMAIAYLRRKEFMQEGMRWFDIKRFHLPVVHSLHWEGTEIVLDRYDKRRALQIPQEAQKVGVVPNER